ncbi:Protein furry [Fasciola gigantica]|uniref:Protein furry n=1 Tax=Fasciola gigantica TaxID=46835 RepID=A0A504YPD0_FASGI|nr:Protein furry [Fasciola gigantica]
MSQATEFVLNNLFYLTLHLAECPSATDCLKQVWVTLTRHRPSNLRVILRYLIVVTSVAPATLLSHAKRLVTYVAYEQPESVLEELVVELQTIDGIGLTVERTTKLPFFRVTTSASRARDVIEPSTEMTMMTTLVKSPLALLTITNTAVDLVTDSNSQSRSLPNLISRNVQWLTASQL